MTILELVLAMTVMLGALLTIAHAGTAGLGVVTKSRQRQEAAGLASQTLERMRALPFDTLVAGLDNGDLANAVNPVHADYDPAITLSGSPAAYRYAGETIAHGDRTVPVDPIFPHLQEDVDLGEVGGPLYDVAAYVTHHDDVLFSGVYRLTVTVIWDDPAAYDGRTQVMAQSLASSPAGCLSTTTHPFSGPCRAFFYGVASYTGGQVGIGPTGSSGPISGLTVDTGRIDLPAFYAGLAVEQTQSVSSFTQMSGGVISYSDATPEGRIGAAVARARATNDITQSGVSSTDTQSVPATSSASLVADDPLSDTYFRVELDSGNVGSAVGTVGATGPDACKSSAGAVLTTLAPCGNARAEQDGDARLRARLELAPGRVLSEWRLARVTGATGYSGTYRDTADSSTTCPVVTGSDRCVRSYAHRELADVRLMNIPTELAEPAGWGGHLLRMTGFQDDVVAAAGEGLTPSPTATLTSPGTISYWNGTGYTSMAASAVADTPIPVTAIDFTDSTTYAPDTVRVRITPSLRTGGTSLATSACTEPNAHCVEARSRSPIVGTITYQIDYNGVSKMLWTMTVDLGSIVATATYKEPPSAV